MVRTIVEKKFLVAEGTNYYCDEERAKFLEEKGFVKILSNDEQATENELIEKLKKENEELSLEKKELENKVSDLEQLLMSCDDSKDKVENEENSNKTKDKEQTNNSKK